MSETPRRIEAIIFDLDGTVIDSRAGIESSALAAMREVRGATGVNIESAWLGAPLGGLIESLAPDASLEERGAIASAFKSHYDETGWRSSRPYDGIREVLEQLADTAVRAFVVTNKRQAPAEAILRFHDLTRYFEAIYTPDSREPRYRSKADMGAACVSDYALVASTLLVVGDSQDDLEMARRCGGAFAAATWGYGLVDEWGDAGRDVEGRARPERRTPYLRLVRPADLEILIGAYRGGSVAG